MLIFNNEVKDVLKKLYSKKYNFFYELFMNEFSSQSTLLSKKLYDELNLETLSKAGLLENKEFSNNNLCRGKVQIFPIQLPDKVLFMLTDWTNPKEPDKEEEDDDESKYYVFPTPKFKEQFYYHMFRAILEIEIRLEKGKKISIFRPRKWTVILNNIFPLISRNKLA